MDDKTYNKAFEEIDACISGRWDTDSKKAAVVERVKKIIKVAEEDCSVFKDMASRMKEAVKSCTHKRKMYEAIGIIEQQAALIDEDIAEMTKNVSVIEESLEASKKQRLV